MADTAPKKKIKVPKVVNGIEPMVEIEADDPGGPAWGPNDKHTLLNHRLPRVDGPVKVSGAAIYSYDVRLPGMLYGRILRSPYAHARVKKIDESAARRIPGVQAIATVQGLRARERPAKSGSAGVAAGAEASGKPARSKQPDLPPHEVLYEAEPTAAVAAISPEIADGAIHALRADFEVL